MRETILVGMEQRLEGRRATDAALHFPGRTYHPSQDCQRGGQQQRIAQHRRHVTELATHRPGRLALAFLPP